MGAKILVVDDDPDIRDVLGTLLESEAVLVARPDTAASRDGVLDQLKLAYLKEADIVKL